MNALRRGRRISRKNGVLLHKGPHCSFFRNASGSTTYADSAIWSFATIGAY